jgi:hypothetical protein
MSYDPTPVKNYADEKGYSIHFTHVPSGRQVSFPAFLKSYSDSYSSQWSTDSIFGRIDPIHLFQQTTRTVSFSIEVPSIDETEAQRNLSSARNLARFLYPTYEKVEAANVINDFPLIRIKFANLIGRGANGIGSGQLLGFIQSVNINVTTDPGFFDLPNALYPKLFELSISFTVQHDEDPTSMMPPEDESPSPYADELEDETATEQTETASVGNNGSEDGEPDLGGLTKAGRVAYYRHRAETELGKIQNVTPTVRQVYLDYMTGKANRGTGDFGDLFTQGIKNVALEEIGQSAREKPDYSFTGQTRIDTEVDDFYAPADEEEALDNEMMLSPNSRR